MGTLARAVVEAADDLTFAGGFAREADPAQRIDDDLARLLDATAPDVLLDFTVHPASVEIATVAVARKIAVVVGTSGWTPKERDTLGALAERNDVGAMLVPNFAIGAVLMMRFAREAAAHFPTVEIVELHHDKKLDAPSGTARATADLLESAGRGPVPIHSVRLRGLVAHQEVLFGGEGETLTIRHDALSRDAFAPGILLALRAIRGARGLSVGLPL